MSDDTSDEQLPMSKEDYDKAIAQIEKVSQSVSKYEWTLERLQGKREKLLMQAVIGYWKSIALKDDFLYSIRLNYSTYEYDCGMLNENLTRELLNLDGVISNGNDEIRTKRKDQVRRVLFLQEAVTHLHEKAVALSLFYRSCVAQPRYQALLSQPSAQPKVELPVTPAPTSEDVEQEAEEPAPSAPKQPSLQRQKSVHLIPVMSPEEFDKLQKQKSAGSQSQSVPSEISSAASASAARRKHNREKKQRKQQRQKERREEEEERKQMEEEKEREREEAMERAQEERRRKMEEERRQREEEEERKRKMEEEEEKKRKMEEEERKRKMEEEERKRKELEEEEKERQRKALEEEEERKRKEKLAEEERKKRELEAEQQRQKAKEEEERKKREQKRLEAQRKAEEKRKATEEARIQAEEARKKAEEAAKQAEEAAKQAEEARRKAEEAEAMEVESSESEASATDEEDQASEASKEDEIKGDYMPKYQWLRRGNKLNLILVNVEFDKSSLRCVTKPSSPTPKLIIQGYRIVQETRPQGYYGVLYGMRPSYKYVPFTTVIQLPDIKVDLSQPPEVLYYDDESVMQVTYLIKQDEPKRVPVQPQRRWEDADDGYGYYPRRSMYQRSPYDAYGDPYGRAAPMSFSPLFGSNFW